VDVLDHGDDRLTPAERREERPPGGMHLGADVLRIERGERDIRVPQADRVGERGGRARRIRGKRPV
jgi:hypothetical protein